MWGHLAGVPSCRDMTFTSLVSSLHTTNTTNPILHTNPSCLFDFP